MEFDIDYEGEISIRGREALSQHAFKQPECATLHVGLGSSAPSSGILGPSYVSMVQFFDPALFFIPRLQTT